MSKGFCALGHCQRCGDTIGPWSLVNGQWLCDTCADEVESNQINILDTDPIQDITEDNDEV